MALGILSVLVLSLIIGGAFLLGRRQRASHGPWTAFEDQVRRSQLVSELQVALLSSADLQKAAVMADTDEASEMFADEGRKAVAAGEPKRRELGELIRAANRPGEVKLFADFSACWKRHQESHETVLGLAVQNTNLKAQRLSFDPASDALARMQAALGRIEAASGPSGGAAARSGAACHVLAAALQIHVLESRHIAEARDEEMDAIEAQMKQLDAQVREGFDALTRATGKAEEAALDESRAAYGDFQKVNAELVDLSRQNTNVRSFAMSLGRARKTTAECESLLEALQRAISSERFEATR